MMPGIELSREQKRVISYRDGHLQIIACAGSGKTETISRRIASLISKGMQPQEIVAFTFTERAAASLKSRILKRVEEEMGASFLDRLGPMYVGTIHSYCFQLLQDHVPQYANYDVLDDHRLAGLLSREHRRLGLDQLGDKHWRPIHDFLRNAEAVENELIDPKKLRNTPFGDCYEKYCRMLNRYHFLTYGQMITVAVRALEDPAVYGEVHGQLKHLVVDEYQDINPAQERLIELLAQPPVHLCVVGDDEQAIYQWRGSDVGNILKFGSRYRDVHRLSLSTNYRSRPKIIKAANGFAQSITPRLPKEMNPRRSDVGPQVCWWSAETPADEASIIADAVQNLVKRGYRYRDIAVLLRSVRTSGSRIVEAFEKQEIPYNCGGRTGLFLQPDAQVLGKTYAWLSDNPWKPEKFDEPQKVEIDDLVEEYGKVFEPGASVARKLRVHLEDWRKVAQDDKEPANLIRDYYRLLRLLGVHTWDLADPKIIARTGSLARFSQLLADYEHVARRARWVEDDEGSVYQAGQNRGYWYYWRLFNYLQHYALDAYEDFEGEDTFDLDVVDILTVHQAKGLEWPVVFIPCLVSDRFPSKLTSQKQDWLLPERVFAPATRQRYEGNETDERRLFYVAMTRAKDVLYLSRFQKIKNARQPSPFLVRVASGDPEKITVMPKRYLPPLNIEETEAESMDRPTLTFSELAAYEYCPLSYRLNALLGFQPQLVAELGYGRAIHHILRRIADYVQGQGKKPSSAQIGRIFQEEFYLPFAHRAAFERLWEAAHGLVNRYMSDYSDDLFRVWETERPFELHLDTGVVAGRADVILDREGGVIGSMALVDYKTATDPRSDDVYAFQLAVYTAAGRGEGLNVRAAYVHDLGKGDRVPVSVGEGEIARAKDRADRLVGGIVSKDFHPEPERHKCGQCDVRFVCQHGTAR